MRVLLWHGYLLRGTGSNIYKANVVRQWRAHGHDVMLMCQERDISGLEYIDAHGDFDDDNGALDTVDTGVAPGPGRVTLVRPSIGAILPVYVLDHYEGFTAKRYVDLTDKELDSYIEANVDALVTAQRRFEPEVVLTSHEVAGPYIAKRAAEQTGFSYAAQLHGSGLEYAVKLQDRYRANAAEGLAGASLVIGGSEYMVREASSVVPGWEQKAIVVNPGCDVELFTPPPPGPHGSPVAGYVGKLITQKGVHNFLAALPLTSTVDLSSVVVGFGDFEVQLRALWEAVQSADLAAIRELVSTENGRLTHLRKLAASSALDDRYFRRGAEISLGFSGRLDHGPLSKVLPHFDVLVVPSVLAEAFGMVGAEAAASGVLPIVPNHSGIAEVGAAVEAAIDRPGLLTYDSDRPIEGIADRIDAILALDPAERAELGLRAARLAHERWSWATVAQTLLERSATAVR